jgi:hypothetical protein
MDGLKQVLPEKGKTENPTMLEVHNILTKGDLDNNISIYDADTGEYYPVQVVCRVTEDDVLDKNHLVLVINKN